MDCATRPGTQQCMCGASDRVGERESIITSNVYGARQGGGLQSLIPSNECGLRLHQGRGVLSIMVWYPDMYVGSVAGKVEKTVSRMYIYSIARGVYSSVHWMEAGVGCLVRSYI